MFVRPIVDLRDGWCPSLPMQAQTFNHRPTDRTVCLWLFGAGALKSPQVCDGLQMLRFKTQRPGVNRKMPHAATCKSKRDDCGGMLASFCDKVVTTSIPEQLQPTAVFAEKRLEPPHEMVPMCFAATILGHLQDRGRTGPRRDC